jgi:hypothetical protein
MIFSVSIRDEENEEEDLVAFKNHNGSHRNKKY